MSEKLKPCPFCGGEVWLFYSSKGNFEFKHKYDSGCAFDSFQIWIKPKKNVSCLADAAEEWNRRVE